MIRYIEAPNDIELKGKSIFLAGGISDCPDWQKPLSERILNTIPDLTVINPRRNDWGFTGKADKESEIQIRWEHRYLRQADAIMFWFPKETLCPITLFELGAALNMYPNTTKIFIGCEPGYQRDFDVRIQTSLLTDLRIVDNLDELYEQIRSWAE
jgi:hypothetical protein